jgi:hypothetical protein
MANERPSPPQIPDHTLLGRIGSGSYGDVWLDRSRLGTLRAVKIVHRGAFEDDRPFPSCSQPTSPPREPIPGARLAG